MGRLIYLPTGNELEDSVQRGVEIATFLTGLQSRGEFPYGARHDPALMFMLAPTLFGISLDDEQAARFAAFLSLTDIRVRSIPFCAAYAYGFAHNGFPEVLDWPGSVERDPEYQVVLVGDPFDEELFVEQLELVRPPSHYDTTAEYLAALNHPLAGELASHWIHCHNHLRKEYGNSWLELVDCPTAEAYSRLISDFKGFGPKVTKLFLGRLRRSGLARHLDTSSLGPAVDRHVVRLTISWGLLPAIVSEVNVRPAVNAADSLWRTVCQKADLPPGEVHQAFWTLGHTLCSPLLCEICPLWQTVCTGKLSMKGYNDVTRKTIDPTKIVLPGTAGAEQLRLIEEPAPPSGPHETIIRLFMGTLQPALPGLWT